MMDKRVLDYYSRSDVQEAILELAKDREVGVMYGSGNFGARPDILQFKADIPEMVKKGATSFHPSEERWTNPLELKAGMTKKQLDELRLGFDLILDIDCQFWDYSKYTAYFLVEALKFHNIKSVGVKYSGNKGFHISIPFEAFPEEVNNQKTKELYPESLRVIAAYLQEMIKEHLAAKILEKETIEEVCKRTGKKIEELLKDGKFNPFSVIDIDTVLISNRHLFRSAYSLHEKSGLVSIPIKPDQILGFEKEMAKPETVRTDEKFLCKDGFVPGEAKQLIIQAFDWDSKQQKKKKPTTVLNKVYELPKVAVKEENFPPCIKKILEGKLEDGKKRSLFILINFLKHMGWNTKAINSKILEWNKKNIEHLREGYVISQLSWHEKQKQKIPPPNCDNQMYYKDLMLCDGKQFCAKFKNPINAARKKTGKTFKQKNQKS